MAKLRIENVGPIRGGFDSVDGFLDFKGVTLFIGNQGTGKSTVAKLYSTLSWIEKALVRGDFTIDYLSQYNRFKKQLAYQNISNYLNDNSIIEYEGNAYKISYQNNQLSIIKAEEKLDYHFPKIMYVPAERNFISTIEKPDLVRRLPLPLYTFLDEYEAAKQNVGKGISLPIGNLRFEYRKQNKKSWLVGEDFKVDLLEASSGFQSLIPLFLVTQYLSEFIKTSNSPSHNNISLDEENRIRKEVDEIVGNANISEDVRRVLLEKLSARFKYSCFLNIVEEPEQNLYPISQKEVLFNLIKHKNDSINNDLVITTHSPYVVNYLTLAIKADNVKTSMDNKDNLLLANLNNIVPLKSTLKNELVNIYQINENGLITLLPNYNGIPSDSNYLNEYLGATNELYDQLLELEDSI